MAFKAGKKPFTIVFQEKILEKNGKDWVLVFMLSSRRQVVEMSAAIFEATEESLKNHRMNLAV